MSESRGQLRWHSRRGLLELDLLLQRFLERGFDQLSEDELAVYRRLLDLADNDLLDLVSGRQHSDDAAVQALLQRIKDVSV